MPIEAYPFLIAIGLFFGTFIVALGGVQIWMALPDRGRRTDA